MATRQLEQPILITRPSALESMAKRISKSRILAVDTESNSLHAYREQVCLIQFSVPRSDYLVDPLILLDLSALSPIFADPKIEKVFHAAEYDLICLRRDFEFKFENLFDTMLAARILGRKKVGLGSLLEQEFGVVVDKRHQRANWGQRPLPDHLQAYARIDTHYLIELRDRLKAELQSAGRWELAQEDFTRLCSINGTMPETNNKPFAFTPSKDLTPQQNAVLLELYRYRDRIARLRDRPLFKVIGDKSLFAIAENCPKSLQDLRQLPGMSSRQVNRHGGKLLDAVKAGLQAKPLPPLPHRPRLDNGMLVRLDLLRNWRKRTARSLRVESDVVLPRDLMVAVADKNPQNFETLGDILQEVPWRLDQFGYKILSVLKNNRGS